MAVGMIPQTEKLKDLVELDENGYVKAGEDGMTSKPGFFVAGDVRAKETSTDYYSSSRWSKCSRFSHSLYHTVVQRTNRKETISW